MKLLVLIAAALVLTPLAADAQDGRAERRTTTSIGEVRNTAGKIQLDVVTEGAKKRAVIFVSDRHVVRTGFLMLEKSELERLRALVDEAIAELEPSEPAPSMSTPR